MPASTRWTRPLGRWIHPTLADNRSAYTSLFTGGRNGFEYLLAYLGIRQKNGMPGHRQTQGRIERFQQTLKRWLRRQPAALDLAALQAQLDAFALALPEMVAVARPTGVGRAISTYTIPIEGRDEWLAAARRLA